MNSQNRIFPVVFLTVAGTMSVPGILAVGTTIWYTNSFFAFFLFLANLYIMNRIYPAFHGTTKRNKTFAVLFAFLLSLALHFGSCLEAEGYVTFTSPWLWVSIFAFTCYFSVMVHALWEKLPIWMSRLTVQEKEQQKHSQSTHEAETNTHKISSIRKFVIGIVDTPWQTWLCILLLWLPVFLAFFPGAFVYDAQDEYVEVASRVFTTHHPLLHVLLLGIPIRAAEHFGLHANVGIACYTIFQMIILSGVFTYMLSLLKKWNCRWQYRLCVLLVLGLFPIFPMYAVCSAKDTLFTACFLMVILLLIVLEKNRNLTNVKSPWITSIFFVVVSVCMMLLRNNGVYAYLLMVPILWIVGRKQHKLNTRNIQSADSVNELVERNINAHSGFQFARQKSISFNPAYLMIISFIFFWTISRLLTFALHATDEEHQEMLTVPIQQLARTYEFAPDTFTEDEKETLYEILSPEALATYSPKISDIIKSQFNNAVYAQDPAKYRSLWIKVGIRKPMVYLNAWFLTSYGYWYPDAVLNCYGGIPRFTFQYTESSYFGFETEPPGVRHSLCPPIEELYRNISLILFQQKVPVVSMLFSPGFLFWVFLFYYGWLLRDKFRDLTVAFSGVILLWLTVLLGPTTLVRYVLILWFIILVLPSEGKKI